MGNQLKQRSYKCNCGTITKEHVWDNELDKTKIKCSNCSNKLTKSDLILANKIEVASIRTPTKNR